MGKHFWFEYEFQPARQGLFATGHLCTREEDAGDKRHYRWVYDCGTANNYMVVKECIDYFVRRNSRFFNDKPNHIALLTLSHFDLDHFSGFPEILQQCSVSNVLLPYIPAPFRYAYILRSFIDNIDAGYTTQQLVDFLQFGVNPLGFLQSFSERNRNNSAVKNLIMVPTPDLSDEYYNSGNLRNEDMVLSSDWEGGRTGSDLEEIVLAPSKRLLIVDSKGKEIFEFLPYNDIRALKLDKGSISAPEDLEKGLKEIIADLKRLGGYAGPELRKIKNQAKSLYKETIGLHDINRGSLFLYAGPVKINRRQLNCVGNFHSDSFPFEKYLCHHGCWELGPNGILYTGDGSLKKKEFLDLLSGYIGISRLSNLACLQVMHHGSEKNYHSGLAKKIEPLVSVFNADPDKFYHHPDALVWREFASYHPMLVNDEGLRMDFHAIY